MSRVNLFEQATLEGYGVQVKDGRVSLVDLDTAIQTDVAEFIEHEWVPIHVADFVEFFGREVSKKLNREMRKAGLVNAPGDIMPDKKTKKEAKD